MIFIILKGSFEANLAIYINRINIPPRIIIIKIIGYQLFLKDNEIVNLFKKHISIKIKIWDIGWEDLINSNMRNINNFIQKKVF